MSDFASRRIEDKTTALLPINVTACLIVRKTWLGSVGLNQHGRAKDSRNAIKKPHNMKIEYIYTCTRTHTIYTQFYISQEVTASDSDR